MSDNRTLIFDLDGTLIDSMTESANVFCEMLLREYGVPEEVSRPVYIELAGMGPRPQFEAVLSSLGPVSDSLVDDITNRYWQLLDELQPVAFPETLEVLQQLHREGHTLAVSSGATTSSVENKLRLTGIGHFFQLALGTDEGVPNMRKGPGHFSILTASLDLREGDLQTRGVFIGDAIHDMQVACEAGLVAVGRITDGNGDTLRAAGADFLIDNLREMRALLGPL